jgi:hypothetical protein
MRLRLGRTRRAGRPAGSAPCNAPESHDLLDVPAAAGRRVLLQLERIGAPLGPVLSVPGAAGPRLHYFVEAGSTAAFKADLLALGWDPGEVDIHALDAAAGFVELPPPDSVRWVRAPESGRSADLPPAHLLLGSLAYACRHPGVRTQASHRRAA